MSNVVTLTTTPKKVTQLVLTPKKNNPPLSNGTSGSLRAAAARNKKRKRNRKFKGRSIVIQADKRWSQHHGYDRKRLEGRKQRAEKKREPVKKRKRSHRAIHNRRHAFFTESEGAHGIGISPTRLEDHVRRKLVRSQKEHAMILGLEMRSQQIRIAPEFLQGIIAMADALREKIIRRMALFAAARQSGRSKSLSQKANTNPSYMGMIQDLERAWYTILKDAKGE